MFFDELSNDEWAQLAALVSDEPAVRLNRRGRPRAEPRIVTNAVLWILTTGEPWSKLPGRYPSGPTCRRRFEEWLANGTLAEMIRRLTRNGRAFAYIPEPTPPAPPKPAPVPIHVAEAPKPRDELARGVYWKSPETWKPAADEPGATNGSSFGWHALAPMADITRQLAGSAAVETGFIDSRAHTIGPVPSDDALTKPQVLGAPTRAPLTLDTARMQPDAPAPATHGHEGQGYEARDDSAPTTSVHHAPLWIGHTEPRGLQFADRHGYVVYVAAERVPNEMFRAWAEIMKDGKRVERSGLIGPRFADADAAHRFALDWARQWIDRECRVHEAAEEQAKQKASVIAPLSVTADVRPVARAIPELTPTPALITSNAAAPGASPVASSVASSGNPHLPQPLNPRVMPLRRYPSTDTTKDTAVERYPSNPKLITHV
ncbi:transposase [Paraburkholderia diazotrophica]|uniref:Transposase n=1 Tax=Paraburkholderia diazotrophica TaxID=667676 RepID=A0A1H6QYL2_9BURK|nr:DUF6566 family protein [Paraburkholderia diazotrophica]SEI46064.1 Transposase [Paraburkholderia diazotrophica]